MAFTRAVALRTARTLGRPCSGPCARHLPADCSGQGRSPPPQSPLGSDLPGQEGPAHAAREDTLLRGWAHCPDFLSHCPQLVLRLQVEKEGGFSICQRPQKTVCLVDWTQWPTLISWVISKSSPHFFREGVSVVTLRRAWGAPVFTAVSLPPDPPTGHWEESCTPSRERLQLQASQKTAPKARRLFAHPGGASCCHTQAHGVSRCAVLTRPHLAGRKHRHQGFFCFLSINQRSRLFNFIFQLKGTASVWRVRGVSQRLS